MRSVSVPFRSFPAAIPASARNGEGAEPKSIVRHPGPQWECTASADDCRSRATSSATLAILLRELDAANIYVRAVGKPNPEVLGGRTQASGFLPRMWTARRATTPRGSASRTCSRTRKFCFATSSSGREPVWLYHHQTIWMPTKDYARISFSSLRKVAQLRWHSRHPDALRGGQFGGR
jgi:hypothetical protein